MPDLERDHAELLRSLVLIPSPSGQERAASEFLAGWMRDRGLRATVDDAGNAVGEAGTGPLHVVLLGHIDTVPGEIPVRVRDGELWGRGSVDAKGALCAFAAAATSLDSGALERMRVTVVGAVEEEAPSSKGARFAVARYRPDLCVIGEPSGWDAFTLGYKGRLIARARATKPNFHSAGDDTTAAEDAIEFWTRTRGWAATTGASPSVFDRVQAALQAMTSSTDGLHQRAEVTVGLRLPPAIGPDDAAARLRELAPAAVDLEMLGGERPYRGPKDTPLTRAFRTAIRTEGGDPRPTLKTGTSDMNVVAPHWACPVLAYGPGDSRLDHAPDERLSLNEFARSVRVLRAALTRLAGA